MPRGSYTTHTHTRYRVLRDALSCITTAPLCGAVLLAPLLQTVPAVLRRLLVVARSIVGVEAVTRFRVHDDLRLAAGRSYRRAHLLDSVLRNACILAAVQPEHGSFQLRGQIDRMLRMKLVRSAYQPPVPGDPRLELRVVRRVEPNDSPAPTESRDRQLTRVAFARLLGPRRRRVEIGHHLGVGNLRHHFRNNVIDVGDLRYIALPRVQLRSYRDVAELCEAPADVLDVFVHSEDLLNDQHDGKRFAFVGHCSIGGNLAVGHWYLYLAGSEPVCVGGDCLARYWLDGQRKPGCQSCDYEFPSGQRHLWLKSSQVFKHMPSPRGI